MTRANGLLVMLAVLIPAMTLAGASAVVVILADHAAGKQRVLLGGLLALAFFAFGAAVVMTIDALITPLP